MKFFNPFLLIAIAFSLADTASVAETQLPVRPKPQTAQATEKPLAYNIWAADALSDQDRVYIRQGLKLPSLPTSAALTISAKGAFSAFVNGNRVATGIGGESDQTVFVSSLLQSGKNVLAITSRGGRNGYGVKFTLKIVYPGGRVGYALSNGDERVSHSQFEGWQNAEFDDSRWAITVVLTDGATPVPATKPNQPAKKPDTTPVVKPVPIPVPTVPSPSVETISVKTSVGNWDTTRLVRHWELPAWFNVSPRTPESVYGGRFALILDGGGETQLPLAATESFNLWQVKESDEPGSFARKHASAFANGFLWSTDLNVLNMAPRPASDSPAGMLAIGQSRPIDAPSLWDPGTVKLAMSYANAKAGTANRGSAPKIFGLPTPIFSSVGAADLQYLCGDNLALASFRGAMVGKYGTVEAVGRAWNSNLRYADDVTFPKSRTDVSRREWVDFLEWYKSSAASRWAVIAKDVSTNLVGAIPLLPIGDSLTSNSAISPAAVASAAKDSNGVIQYTVPGARTVAGEQSGLMGRLATASKLAGVPYFINPIGVTADAVPGYIFSALSSGAVGLTLPQESLVTSRDLLYRNSRHLRSGSPIVDVAMFYPSTFKAIHPELASLPIFTNGCTQIRDVLNYDILDEPLVQNGSLDHYRVLVLWEGTVVEKETLARIRDWVQAGGVLVGFDFGKIETVEGDKSWFTDVFGFAGKLNLYKWDGPDPRPGEVKLDSQRIRKEWSKPYGRGWTVFFPAHKNLISIYYEVVRYLTYHLSELDNTKRNAATVDDAWDGILATQFADRSIYLNTNTSPVKRSIEYSNGGQSVKAGINLEPGQMGVIPTAEVPQELMFQCEGFRSIAPLTPSTGVEHFPGSGLTHVLIPSGKSISTRFQIDQPGEYRLFYRCTRRGQVAVADLLVDNNVVRGGTRGGFKPGNQTLLAGTLKLTPGIHTLTVRARVATDVRADFVVFTTDQMVAGYGFAVNPGSGAATPK